MIITDKFVFVHIPRTGGSFIREVFIEYGGHLNPVFDYFHHAPAQVYRGNLPIMFVNRDYESWVKSWTKYWSFRPKESTNPLLACIWSEGDFQKYYVAMYKYMTATENNKIELSFNNLRSELCIFIKNLDALTDDLEKQIMTLPKINESTTNPIK